MTSTTTKPSQPRRNNRRGEGQRLREELLAAADAIVTETGDGSALSLRSVAARAGVAATSVYLHFADIDALKAALAQRCFAEFAAARDQAAAGAADPAATLIAGCQAYVRYALDHPGQYRLMFSPDLPTLSPSISTGPDLPDRRFGVRARSAGGLTEQQRLRRSGQLDSTLPTRRHRSYRHRPHQAGRAGVDRPARTGVAAHEPPRLPLATAREHDHRTRHPTHQSPRRGLANRQCRRDDRARTRREAALRHAAGCAGADPRRTRPRSGKHRADPPVPAAMCSRPASRPLVIRVGPPL